MTVAAMLGKPDFYKVGVAASGNHDNNIYRQQWAETFHGVQNTGSCFTCKVPTNIENAGITMLYVVSGIIANTVAERIEVMLFITVLLNILIN